MSQEKPSEEKIVVERYCTDAQGKMRVEHPPFDKTPEQPTAEREPRAGKEERSDDAAARRSLSVLVELLDIIDRRKDEAGRLAISFAEGEDECLKIRAAYHRGRAVALEELEIDIERMRSEAPKGNSEVSHRSGPVAT